MTKNDEVRGLIASHGTEALLIRSATMQNRDEAEILRRNASDFAKCIAYFLCEKYRFLELTDTFEWKRERVRR